MLVDDHQSLLWGLSKLIEGAAPTLELAGTASDLDEALEIARRVRPDIVLLDLDMNGRSSFEILPELLALDGVKVIILSGHRDPLLRQQAMMLGASGFIGKDQPAQVILTAIERVQAGEIWLDRASMSQVFNALTHLEADPEAQRIASLTAKERDIIASLASSEGKPNKILAVELGMADHTLRNHLSIIYGKLGVKTRLALYMYVIRHGLADPN
ncbi:MAG: DNA-binding response regulator [Hydrogenophilales bacterium 17-61-9]|nr:MAG: DNA-binding response regulator [Hydrogenophilales bacterium 17-61-9]